MHPASINARVKTLRSISTGQDSPRPVAITLHPARGEASPSLPAARILELQAAVVSHETFAEAAAAFATEVAAALHFDRAAIGLAPRGTARIVATSHTADFEPHGELFRAFAAAMDEALDQSSTIAFPAAHGARPLITLAHAELHRRYGGGSVCTIPLVSRGAAFGALTLVRAGGDPVRAEEIALCERVASALAPVLELKHGIERPWHQRLRRGLRKAAGRVVEPGNLASKLGIGVAAGILAGLLFVPVQYRVGAQARIEGSVQRALVAPADGFLRRAHVRPGDRVKTDQVLAELAEDDLRLEHRKLQSEHTQHENAASAALARADRAQYAIAQAKADETRAQVELLDAQLVRGRVQAPFDGVIIKGDLSQSLGAPVRKGEVLLTIAASDKFRLLMEVDERDIGSIAAGQNGSVALGALSDRALRFRVERVTPVATAREGRNFFEVEGALEDTPPVLRPGLQGVAKIEAGRRPLAWIWTHRLIEGLRLGLWSWGL